MGSSGGEPRRRCVNTATRLDGVSGRTHQQSHRWRENSFQHIDMPIEREKSSTGILNWASLLQMRHQLVHAVDDEVNLSPFALGPHRIPPFRLILRRSSDIDRVELGMSKICQSWLFRSRRHSVKRRARLNAFLCRRAQVIDMTRKHRDLTPSTGLCIKSEEVRGAAVHDRVRLVGPEEVAGEVGVERQVVVPSLQGSKQARSGLLSSNT